MRRGFITTTIATIMMFAGSALLHGQTVVVDENTDIEGVTVTNAEFNRSGEYLKVMIDMDLSKLKVKANRAVLLTPHLVVDEVDSLDLPSVGIYARQRYFYYARNEKKMLTEPQNTYRKRKDKDKYQQINYVQLLEYPTWATNETMEYHLRRSDYGCCGKIVEQWDALLAETVQIPAYYPAVIYARPSGTQPIKERSIEGSAYIDFVVDKTDIREDYHSNAIELKVIRQTVDTVKNDIDTTIKKITLKGFASPEGTYNHNADLARGRTAALKDYLKRLYGFDDSMFETSYEPEDWAGLRERVQRTGYDLAHRDEIIALIDSDMDPDAKDHKIRDDYPTDYAYILRNIYPSLRHTDYVISYTIREYTEIDEIQAVFETNPEKLSPNEFYLLSQQYEPGTEEFAKIFETEIALYPDDEAANLNSASAALRLYDFDRAVVFLQKAGNSGEAQYERGVYYYWVGDFDAAINSMRLAKEAGVAEAEEVLSYLESHDSVYLEAGRVAALEEISEGAVSGGEAAPGQNETPEDAGAEETNE